jgi:hypothetical protein
MGRECVRASQLRCTSKSVDLLPDMVSMDEGSNMKIMQVDVLGRKQQHLERRGHNGALRNRRIQFCHGKNG